MVAVVDIITSGQVREDPTKFLAWPAPLAAKHFPGTTSSKTAHKR